MTDFLIKISIYYSVGIACWMISQKYYIKIYGLQQSRFFDYIYLPVSALLAILYAHWVEPVLFYSLDKIHIHLDPMRNFFLNSTVWLQIITFIVISDFFSYWTHRLLHTPFFWSFHAFHHSPLKLNWLSGMRGSPVHMILTLAPVTISAAVFLYFDNKAIGIALLLGDAFIQHWIHSNIDVPGADKLEKFFVTPRMHFVHHHPNPKYTDTNFGFTFSIWDKLFGTYTNANDVKQKGLLGIDYPVSLLRQFIGLNPTNKIKMQFDE